MGETMSNVGSVTNDSASPRSKETSSPSSKSVEQQYLDDLMAKYVENTGDTYTLRCVWDGYVSSYSVAGRMAQTSYMTDRDRKIKTATITMSKAFMGRKPFTQRSALYHEFCHAEAWYEEGAHGHTTPWIKRWLRKPVLSIGGVFTCLFWYLYYEVR